MTSAPRILICGWAGAGNIGDELLTRSIVELVRTAGGSPVVASRDPQATRTLHPGIETVRWGPTTAFTARHCEGVIVGPGGIIQDSSSVWSLPGHLVGPLVHRWRGTPVTGVGLGAEPLRRRSSRWLLRRTLDGTEPIVRDLESAAAFGAAGVAAAIAPDIAFTQPTRNVVLVQDERRLVVAIGGGVAPGAFRPAARRISSDDPPVIAAALDSLAERMEATVAFVSIRGERDRALAASVAPLMSAAVELIEPELDATLDALAAADLVVSSRYHSSLVAVRNGVPVVVISEQPKLWSLVAQINDAERIRLINGWDDLVAFDPPRRFEPYEAPDLDPIYACVAALVTRCGRSG